MDLPGVLVVVVVGGAADIAYTGAAAGFSTAGAAAGTSVARAISSLSLLFGEGGGKGRSELLLPLKLMGF